MITEDYVSFETAKLLKEKGFNCKCNKCYAYFADDDIRVLNLEYSKLAQLLIEDRYPYVTPQMAMKWLRETQGLYVTIRTMFIEKKVMYDSVIQYIKNNKHNTITDENSYNKIEEATEAVIKYCLENFI